MRSNKQHVGQLLLTALIAASGLHAQESGHEGHSHGPDVPHSEIGVEVESLPPGVIAIPQSVRDNLGVTFATVESRVVQGTMRLPGRFEAAPHAKSEYRIGARGQVTLLVQQYDRVAEGDLLFRMESEAWREAQSRMSQAELAADLIGEQELASARGVQAATAGVEAWRRRLESLEELQGLGAGQAPQLAEAHSELAAAEGALAEALIRSQATRIEALSLSDSDGANPRFAMAIREAATLMGAEEDWLIEKVEGRPRWQSLRAIEIRARRSGVVQSIEVTDGALVGTGDLILRTIEPKEIRFRGFALQADLGTITDGSPVHIVPPHGGISSYSESLEAVALLGTEADPDERTIDVIATPVGSELPVWARPGVAAFVEIVVSGSAERELAIPISAVANDGADRIFFLRDRNDPDRVRRVVADLGGDDGRWIIVNSGVRRGDEVVLEGAYELKLTGSGTEQQGGHFHGDGTFHVGED